jgi:hypothetical protein
VPQAAIACFAVVNVAIRDLAGLGVGGGRLDSYLAAVGLTR